MAETLRFDNFNVETDSVFDIGAQPEVEDMPERPGVIEEIKTVFGHEDENLGELIGRVAPHMTLQDNIDYAKEKLSEDEAREKIGYADEAPVDIARAWGERSGLQAEVLRPLMEPAKEMPDNFAAVVVTDGVANWMKRMTSIAIEVGGKTKVDRLLFAAGARRLGTDETHLAPGGMSVADFMRQELIPAYGVARFGGPILFDTVELVRSTNKDGASVMRRAARQLDELDEVDLQSDRIVIPAVAGNWMQKGVQARQALQGIQKGFDEDPEARQLWVASRFFPLGFTGREPKGSYQNPYSAIGNILRGAKLLQDIQ
ncbi:MAG: hypothetical protein WD885_02830 [Candidatus Saccharimonadales bacterium]